MNFLIKDTSALEKGFYATRLEVQEDLDQRLKPLGKRVIVPGFCILPLSDDQETLDIIKMVQENQEELEATYKNSQLTEQEKTEKIDELQANNIAFIETLDAMSALYCIDIDGTYADMEEQLFDQRIKTYELLDKVYIKPDEVYSGAYTNNIVHVQVYSNDLVRALIAEIYIPINFTLNTYGLQSLNAWDGNSVEINEEGKYILAPQIGAGSKNEENNTFTGILMGEAVQYDTLNDGNVAPTSSIGLFGYSEGRQSIFLDAESGAAYFGLAEDEVTSNDGYKIGRISLIPDGTSHVGSWNLGASSFYSMNNAQGETLDDLMKPGYDNQYETSIPNDSSGILLTARPEPYMSIKGVQLNSAYSLGGIDYTRDNIAVQPHDTFELQLDPQDSSIFTLYRHTMEPKRFKDLVFGAEQSVYSWAVVNTKENATGALAGTYSSGDNNKWRIYKKIKATA